MTGFNPIVVNGIQLHVNDRLDVPGKLGVGGVTESVEVNAATQFVQPSPAVQTLMGPTQVQELPLNNRNFVSWRRSYLAFPGTSLTKLAWVSRARSASR